jgi:RNA polymerase sigma-70 factor (ECF subfamily)
MSEERTLKELIVSSQAGEYGAFQLLYERLSKKVFRFVRARTYVREDALDVLQDTFVDYWKTLPSFRYESDASIYAFLYTIASRKIYKLYKKQKPAVTIESVADTLRDPDDPEARSEAVLVADSLSRLKESEREMIELRYFAGMTFVEIAELLGQTETSVKVRHHRTIGKLKQFFGYESA